MNEDLEALEQIFKLVQICKKQVVELLKQNQAVKLYVDTAELTKEEKNNGKSKI